MGKPQSISSGSNTTKGGTLVDPVITNYLPQYAPLNKAIRYGEWDTARNFFNDHPGTVTARISIDGKTSLHVASLFKHLHIVEELLQLMSVEEVELQDFKQLTALHEATYANTIEIAKCLVEKNNKLLTITGGPCGTIPLIRALGAGHTEMARYLYSVTPWEELTPEKGYHGSTLLNMCFNFQMLDIALDLLKRCPSLAATPDRRGSTFLQVLASMPSAFPSGCQLSFWQRWIYKRVHIQQEPKSVGKNISVNMPETSTSKSRNMMSTCFGIKNIYETKLGHMQCLELLRIACHELYALNEEQLQTSRAHLAVIQAAEKGIPEIFIEVLKVHIHLLWDSHGTELPFFRAIQFRQENIFSLIHGIYWKQAVANETDQNDNILLHVAGMLAPSAQLHRISGAALQMQRELHWFKEVESITPPTIRESSNKYNMTPRALFTKEHKDLVKEGEKWMKGTAASCTVVAALVATIVFASGFTVPGGNDQNTGYPIFRKKNSFILFIISNAVSLFSSSTSILMFLGILTSRYAEDDFLKSLPTKLIIGLSTLFISMATMLIAFCAALFIMLHGKAWIVVSLSILACVPITLFVLLQFPLLLEITMSTYGPSIFDKNVKKWLS